MLPSAECNPDVLFIVHVVVSYAFPEVTNRAAGCCAECCPVLPKNIPISNPSIEDNVRFTARNFLTQFQCGRDGLCYLWLTSDDGNGRADWCVGENCSHVKSAMGVPSTKLVGRRCLRLFHHGGNDVHVSRPVTLAPMKLEPTIRRRIQTHSNNPLRIRNDFNASLIATLSSSSVIRCSNCCARDNMALSAVITRCDNLSVSNSSTASR